MNSERDIWSNKTLPQAKIRIAEIEHDVDLLGKCKDEFFDMLTRFKVPYDQVDKTDLDYWNEQLRRLHDELFHLETFVIESE
jgi:hypothetical protein